MSGETAPVPEKVPGEEKVLSAAEKALSGEAPEKKASEVPPAKEVVIEAVSIVIEQHLSNGKTNREVVVSKSDNYFVGAFNDKGLLNTWFNGLSPMLAAFMSDYMKYRLVNQPLLREEIMKRQQIMEAVKRNGGGDQGK